jgi:hypothetical protein
MRGGERSNERAIGAAGSSGGAQRRTRGSSVQHWQPGGRASIARRIVVLVLAAMLTATAYHLSVGRGAIGAAPGLASLTRVRSAWVTRVRSQQRTSCLV